MKKEFLLGLVILACLPGCWGEDDVSYDASTPANSDHDNTETTGVAGEHGNHDEGVVGTYADYRDPNSHVGIENAEVVPGDMDMNELFDKELKKWEDELENFAKFSENDTFEMNNWKETELGAPVFMASTDELMNKVEVQDAIERTVIQYEKAKKEGTNISVLCQEYAWAELDQAVAEEFKQELVAAGISADDIKVVARVAEYDHSMPPHRVEISMQTT